MRALTIETTKIRAIRLVEQPDLSVVIVENTLQIDDKVNEPRQGTIIATVVKERRQLVADFLKEI